MDFVAYTEGQELINRCPRCSKYFKDFGIDDNSNVTWLWCACKILIEVNPMFAPDKTIREYRLSLEFNKGNPNGPNRSSKKRSKSTHCEAFKRGPKKRRVKGAPLGRRVTKSVGKN